MSDTREQVTVEVVYGPKVSVTWEEGLNAQQALERAYAQISDTEKFTYALQYFGPALGYLVCMINETYDTFPNAGAVAAQPYYYWDFLVDGNPAPKGIDGTVLNAGATISFRYDRYDPAAHGGTTLEAKFEARSGATNRRGS